MKHAKHTFAPGVVSCHRPQRRSLFKTLRLALLLVSIFALCMAAGYAYGFYLVLTS